MIRLIVSTAVASTMLTVAASAQISPQQYILLFGKSSSASGSNPGSGCTNQLVLDYSNSCALIGQAFGQ